MHGIGFAHFIMYVNALPCLCSSTEFFTCGAGVINCLDL